MSYITIMCIALLANQIQSQCVTEDRACGVTQQIHSYVKANTDQECLCESVCFTDEYIGYAECVSCRYLSNYQADSSKYVRLVEQNRIDEVEQFVEMTVFCKVTPDSGEYTPDLITDSVDATLNDWGDYYYDNYYD